MGKKILINKSEPGVDSLKGGIFFDSSLIPNGTFKNIPQYIESEIPTETKKQPSLVLTLERIKEELQKEAKKTQKSNSDILSEENINSFLTSFTQLLIDYSDLKNFTFFGSSYTELNYNIKYIVENFPFKSYVAVDYNLPGNPEIEIIPLSNNRTQITFSYLNIEEGSVLPFTETDNFNWNEYDFVDSNNKKFPIEAIISPYNEITSINRTTNIFSGKDNITINTQDNHNYDENSVVEVLVLDSNGGTVISDQFKVNVLSPTQFDLLEINNDKFKVSQIILGDPVTIVTDKPHSFQNNDHVRFYDINLLPLDGSEFIIGNVTSNTFQIYHTNGVSVNGVGFSVYDGLAKVSKIFKLDSTYSFVFNSGYTRFSLTENKSLAYSGDYKITFVVTGNISKNNLIEYTNGSEFFKGLIISPKAEKLTDFDVKIDEIQKAILYNNPAPWPKEPVTNNIISFGNEYENWIQNPNNLTRANLNDIGLYQLDDLSSGLNLTSALSLDESETNQIIRKAIPHRVIDELRDADEGYFRRFILIASKFFDIVKVYIDFLKYVHHVDYSNFNQLSPEYYSLYADLYNFNLVSSDIGDKFEFFLKSASAETLKSSKYNRQKKLLLNLLYLYKTKGVQETIKYLVVGIGFPSGLIRLEEFSYEVSNKDSLGYSPFMYNRFLPIKGEKRINNEKVFVPEIQFEVDPNYTKIDFISNWGIIIPNKLDVINTFYNVEVEPPKYSVFDNEFTPTTGPFILIQNYNYQRLLISVTAQNLDNLETLFLGEAYTESIDEDEDIVISRLIQNINSRTRITGFSSLSNDNNKTISIYAPPNKRRWELLITGDILVDPSYSTEIKISYKNPVYRYRVENEEDINLREINLLADSQNAILEDIVSKNKFESTFGYFYHRNYANLQKETGDYYLLPLTFPDKYYGIGLRYMIPKNGFFRYLKNDAKNQIDIGSLYQVGSYNYPAFLNSSYNYPSIGERSKAIIVFGNFSSGSIQININDGGPQAISNSVSFNTDQKTTINDLIDDINSFVSSYSITAERLGEQNAIVLYGPYDSPNDIAGFTLNITGTIPVNAFSEFSTVNSEKIYDSTTPFIIARVENGNLVVRARLNDENNIITIPEERIAVFPNLFKEDGLIHQLKLNYRPLGVEVFQDNKFLGVAKWVDISPDFVISVDYKEILNSINNETANYSKFSSLFAEPPNNLTPDSARWWDLYIGNPIGMDFYFESVQVYESLGINYPNPTFLESDLEGNNESEIYNFKFSNNLSDDLNFEIPVEFRKFELNTLGGYDESHYIIPDLPNDQISNIKIWNKKYDVLNSNYPLGVEIIKSIPDFYKVSDLETLDEKTIFKYNSWCKTIHKDYEYSKLKSSLQNYYALYANTISHKDLIPFVDSIDNRFKNLIKDFVPIVINIMHFGKLISNNVQNLPKIHYPGIHKICNGQIINNGSKAFFRINYGESGPGNNIDLKLLNSNISLFSSPIQFQGTKFITSQLIVNEINSNFSSNEIEATRYGSVIEIKINPEWYFLNYGLNLKDESIDYIINGVILTEEIEGFTGSEYNNITSDCFQLEITNYKNFEEEDETLFAYYSEEEQLSIFSYYDNENILNFFI